MGKTLLVEEDCLRKLGLVVFLCLLVEVRDIEHGSLGEVRFLLDLQNVWVIEDLLAR